MSSSTDQQSGTSGGQILATEALSAPFTTFAVDQPGVRAEEAPIKPSLAPVPSSTLTDYLTRPVQIAVWAASTAPEEPTIPISWEPWSLWLNHARIKAKLNGFTYIRGELEVTALVTASPALYGIVDLTLFPCGPSTSDVLYSAQCPLRAREGQHVTIDLSLANSATFVVPWFYQFDYAPTYSEGLDTEGPNNFVINVVTYHDFVSGIAGGETNVRITLFARLLPGYEIAVQRYQSGRAPAPGGSGKTWVKEKAEQAGAYLGGLAASYFGFSRDHADLTVVGVRTSAIDAPNSTDPKDHSLSLALVGDGVMDTMGDAAIQQEPVEDLLDFSSLVSRPTYILGATISKETAVGAQICRIPVAPGWWKRRAGVGAADFELPVVGHVALPFSFWRGSLIYTFEVCAPTTSRAILQIYWEPEWTNGVEEPSLISHLATISASGRQTRDFVVGHAVNRPWLRTALVDSARVAGVGPGVFNGTISVRLLNPCECVNPDASIFLRVWVRGGKDFECAQPAAAVVLADSGTSVQFTPVKGFCYYQSGSPQAPLGGSVAEMSTQHHVLVPSLGTGSMLDAHFPGQGVRSARAMIQKHTAYQMLPEDFGDKGWPQTSPSTDTPVVGLRVFDIKGPQMLEYEKYWGEKSTNHLTGVGGFNYAAYYLRMFAGWSGSQYYAWVNPSTMAVECSILAGKDVTTPAYVSGQYSIPGAAVQYTGTNGGASFQVPYSCHKKYYETGADESNEDQMNLTVNFRFGQAVLPGYDNNFISKEKTMTNSPILYHCAGPDVKVYFYRQAPRLTSRFYYPYYTEYFSTGGKGT